MVLIPGLPSIMKNYCQKDGQREQKYHISRENTWLNCVLRERAHILGGSYCRLGRSNYKSRE